MTKNTELDFDFNELALEETSKLHLAHPKDDGTMLYAPVAKGQPEDSRPVELNVYGPASPQFRKAMDVMHKKTAKRGKREATAEESREQSVEFLVAVPIDFSNIKFDGEVVDNAEAFRKLYSNPKYEWVTKQATAFLFTDSNFLVESKSS